jgi:hypothetical protein
MALADDVYSRLLTLRTALRRFERWSRLHRIGSVASVFGGSAILHPLAHHARLGGLGDAQRGL